MILIDTNVVSEPLKAKADPAVIDWLDRQALETLYLSAISLAELRSGMAILPEGKRKTALQSLLERRIADWFGVRILTFNADAASAYADIIARTRSSGTPIGTADALIAATAMAWGFKVATRDTAPFEAANLPVINPWEAKYGDNS